MPVMPIADSRRSVGMGIDGSRSGSQIIIDNQDHAHALQTVVTEELKILDKATDHQIQEVKENHLEARERVRKHCLGLFQCVARREVMLLKEIDELERIQISLLTRRKKILDKLDDSGSTTTADDTTAVEEGDIFHELYSLLPDSIPEESVII